VEVHLADARAVGKPVSIEWPPSFISAERDLDVHRLCGPSGACVRVSRVVAAVVALERAAPRRLVTSVSMPLPRVVPRGTVSVNHVVGRPHSEASVREEAARWRSLRSRSRGACDCYLIEASVVLHARSPWAPGGGRSAAPCRSAWPAAISPGVSDFYSSPDEVAPHRQRWAERVGDHDVHRPRGRNTKHQNQPKKQNHSPLLDAGHRMRRVSGGLLTGRGSLFISKLQV